MALYAFDGTWNVRDSKAAIETIRPTQYGPDASFRRETVETNVHRFKEFYELEGCAYLQGVGTRVGIPGSLAGGAFGLGGKFRIREMYRELCRRYHHANDKAIDIVGFSRGAALAVHFTNVISRHGVRHPSNRKRLLWYYRGLGWMFMEPGPGPEDVTQPAIRFLGLWDTVGSFGLPLGRFRNRLKRWWITRIPDIVQHTFHAMALDEVRATFALVRPAYDKDDDDRLYQVWFRGVHSNVGGGYPDRGLSDIPLAWMMEMYLWVLGEEKAKKKKEEEKGQEKKGKTQQVFEEALRMLAPEPGPPPDWVGKSMETLEPDPEGELMRPAALRRDAWRELHRPTKQGPEPPKIHHSVFRRPKNLIHDHYASNRRLLRALPRDAFVVYDPPFFYTATPRQEAILVAEDAFRHIPVRSADWLKLGTEFVFRGDDWVAVGQRRGKWQHDVRKEAFVLIATEWLMSGRAAHDTLVLPSTVEDFAHQPVASILAAEWVVDVLEALDPYVRSLRMYTPPAAVPPPAVPAPAGSAAPPAPSAAAPPALPASHGVVA